MNPTKHKAQRECIARLLQAFLREQLLSISKQNDTFIIPLSNTSASLQLQDLTISSLRHYQIKGDIFYLKSPITSPKQIADPMQLLTIIKPELGLQLDQTQWEHFVKEIENHVDNTVLTDEYSAHYRKTLLAAMNQAGVTNFFQWILSQNIDNKSLFYEQWTTQGHPYHPCSKTKLGLSPQDVIQYSPEFHQQTSIYIGAIHRDIVHIEAISNDLQYIDWFFEHFPNIKTLWALQLKLNGLDSKNYIPLPIHPWQAVHIIHSRFKALLESGYLHIFESVTLPTNPTLSFRTVVPISNPYQPHIKLPIAVQTTSAIRTVSPDSTENGPKISFFLSQILAQENNFNGTLRFMPELIGLHAKGFADETAKHLSVIFRDNVNNHLYTDETGIVVAALFEKTPVHQVLLLIEIMQHAGVNNVDDAKRYFQHYAKIVLNSYLDLYLLYGVALEAHQQNTIAVFHQGNPVATIARDFGGLRLHLPTFKGQGFNLVPYPGSATLREERDEVRNKLLHTTYQYHLGEWIFHLSQYYNVPESTFWILVREITEERFDVLKARMEPTVWQQERHAILEKDWVLKALLRMRLDNVSHDYIYVPITNPLKET